MKILVVDDDTAILEITKMYLEFIGYDQVDAARSGSIALELMDAADAPYTCILLDINMPGISGIEMIPAILGRTGYADASIIMTTAMDDKSLIAAAFVAGALDYVIKPYDFADLEARLLLANDRLLKPAETALVDLLNTHALPPSWIVRKYEAWLPPIDPADDAGLVSLTAFVNCLSRLQMNTHSRLDIIAMKLENLDGIADKLGKPACSAYQSGFKSCLLEDLQNSDCVMSYGGEGLYLLLACDANFGGEQELTRAAQRALTKAEQIHLADAGIAAGLQIGFAHYDGSSSEAQPRPVHLLARAVSGIVLQ